MDPVTWPDDLGNELDLGVTLGEIREGENKAMGSGETRDE